MSANRLGVKSRKMGRMSIEERSRAVGMLQSGLSLRQVVLTIYHFLNISIIS